MGKYSGYTEARAVLETMELFGHWVVIQEELEHPDMPFGLIAVNKKNTTIGRVLVVGARVGEDIVVGDRVLFEEWQGGRWQFERIDGSDVNALIMDEQYILARIGDERSS